MTNDIEDAHSHVPIAFPGKVVERLRWERSIGLPPPWPLASLPFSGVVGPVKSDRLAAVDLEVGSVECSNVPEGLRCRTHRKCHVVRSGSVLANVRSYDFAHETENFPRHGVSPGLVLRVDQIAVDLDVEDATRPWLDDDFVDNVLIGAQHFGGRTHGAG